MDSDDDGAYGYDMPEDGGPGFSLGSKPSHRQGAGGGDDSSADEAHDSSDDGNFAYGASAARRRRKRERQSGATDKERNLYGVFYEDSSDEDRRGGARGGKRSRHFDKRSNRQAGLAFVKASSAAPSTGGEKGGIDGENGDAGGAKTKSDREGAPDEPGWLKGTPRDDNGGAADDYVEMEDKQSNGKKSTANSDEDEEEDALDEEELKLLGDQEQRFKDLLAVATTSKTPLPSAKQSKPRAGEKPRAAVPTVGIDDVGLAGGNDAVGLGLGFGNSRQDEDRSAGPQTATTGLGFAGSSTESKPSMSDNGSAGLGIPAQTGLGHQGGLGLGSKRGPPIQPEERGGLGLGMGNEMGGMGGLGSNFPSFAQGGMGLGLGHSSQPAKKKDPNLGKWEKHTKGIGMKLLQKMGYEGSGGLGAKRRRPAVGSLAPDADAKRNETAPSADAKPDAKGKEEGPIKKGISRPVEVVVRPNGLGLGFGNFKEQSQLKVNRQIEAEVRGLELPKDETKKKSKGEKGIFDGIDKSLLPSTESLLNRGASSWRKGKGSKKAKRKIVNYQDILNESATEDGKMKIIDMRGAPTASETNKASTSSSPAVQLGEELLHNVTLLLNTHEGQLRTASYMVKSTEQKIASLEAERKEMADRKEGIEQRRSKMKLALEVIEEAEQLIDKLSSMNKGGSMSSEGRLVLAMGSLRGILANLYSNFSKEERKGLKFDTTLVPSIVDPLLETLTSTVNPLEMDLSWLDRFALGAKKLCDAVGSENEAYALRETIFLQSIVPWVQRFLSSSKWDPAVDVETGIRLYEALLKCAYATMPDAEQGENDILKESITDEVVQKTVLPKLLRAVSHWKPRFDGAQEIANPLHLWILPWLPHINNDSTLGTLLDDARRSVKKTVSFLSKSVLDDVQFVRSCIATLGPWKRLFQESIFEVTSTSISPRLARSLARVQVSIVAAKQEWDLLRVLFDCYEAGLMSRDDFLCLIEGEVLPSWANALYCASKQKEWDLNAFKEFYVAWKRLFFIQSAPGPQLALRSDTMVCRYFYGGLKMIQAMAESNEEVLGSLAPPHPADCNYRISLMRRSKEERGPETDGNGAVNAKVQPKVRGVGRMEASFQEVVEEFANQHDVAFVPKTGSGATKDGKPVFLFGNHPVFMEKNVLFAKRGSSWQPISLEHLLQSC